MSTFNYRLTVSYDGSLFEGWQVQLPHQRTIQGEINKALQKIAKSEDIQTLGSGRTDSGVHALAQVVKVTIPLEIEADALKRALNSHLCDEIRVLKSQVCDSSFHPVRDALWKTYQYIFYEGAILPPQHRNLMTHAKSSIDWNKVGEALKLFRGEHDFINYSTKGTIVKSTIRQIYDTGLELQPFRPMYCEESQGTMIKISVTGNGFLKQMVRLVVGTAVSAGLGKVSHEQIKSSFEGETPQKLAAVAPPQGLYLFHVEYDKHYSSVN